MPDSLRTLAELSQRTPPHTRSVAEELVELAHEWLLRSDLQSYDWWDMWGTNLGGWAKTLYVKNRLLGSLFVGPLLFADLLVPQVRRWFATARQFPICHAHMGLAYLNLYELWKDERYFKMADALVAPLLAMASPLANGLGWGMKHEWMTIKGLIPKDTPCHTQTAYAFDFFHQLYRMTNSDRYRDYVSRIAIHEAGDFPEWWQGSRLVSSYSLADNRHVVNANSYRMYILLTAGATLNNHEYTEKGLATLRYVLSMQAPDGSWPYAEDERFVDTYHTCFVLKNLYRVRELSAEMEKEVTQAIETGVRYYFDHLFDERGYPVPFAVAPRLTLHKYDSYDLAESIGLLARTGIDHKRLQHLVKFARDVFQTRDGWFLFRVYRFPAPSGIPYMRYANTAMFLALTEVLRHEERKGT